MLDKNTFGSTPACIYLADSLEVHNKRMVSRVSKILQETRETLNQLYDSHQSGKIDIHNYKKLLKYLREDVLIKIKSINNELISDLVTNILIGEIKSYSRLLVKIGRDQEKLQNQTPEKVTAPKLIMNIPENHFKREAAEAVIKSKTRLAKQNKVCNFY